MSYSMSRRIDNCGEVSRERTHQPFPFLRLPAEIRNEIYRLLLLTQNVTTDKPATSRSFRTPGEVPGGVASVQLGEVATGTIRGKCRQTYTMRYQIAIILTNKQIYREARGIFQLENFWTLVQVNKAGFTKEMKDRNFPVVTVPDDCPWRHVKFPVMTVTVMFPSLVDQKQSDTFVVATIHLKWLMRALWTAKGASDMLVTIHVHPPCIQNSPSESYLLRPFFKLRSIKQLVILGVSKREYADELTRAITTTDGIDQIFSELAAGVKCVQRYIQAKQWRLAITRQREHSILLIDCRSVYQDSNRFIGSRASTEIYTATTIIQAEICLYSDKYTLAISFADQGLSFISKISFLQNLNPVSTTVVVPPYHQLLSPADTITSENEIKCKILLIRARAYMATRQPENAFDDIETAREILPNSETVASISEACFAGVTNHMDVDHMDVDHMDVDNMDVDNMDVDNVDLDNMDFDPMDLD